MNGTEKHLLVLSCDAVFRDVASDLFVSEILVHKNLRRQTHKCVDARDAWLVQSAFTEAAYCGLDLETLI